MSVHLCIFCPKYIVVHIFCKTSGGDKQISKEESEIRIDSAQYTQYKVRSDTSCIYEDRTENNHSPATSDILEEVIRIRISF